MQNYTKKTETNEGWLTDPVYTKEQMLDQLDAGRLWVDYLVANGWVLNTVTINQHSRAYGSYECVTLSKRKHVPKFGEVSYLLSFQNSYEHGCEFTCFQSVEGKSWMKNKIQAEGFEQDLTQFAFLCDGMGWVPIKEADNNCKLVTGSGLIKYLLNKTENAKETETHNLRGGLVASALQMAEA